MSEKKAKIEDYTVYFGYEAVLNGSKKESVTFRRPKTKEIRSAEACKDGYEQTNQLTRVLTGLNEITNEEFDELDYEDYANLSKVALGFLKS